MKSRVRYFVILFLMSVTLFLGISSVAAFPASLENISQEGSTVKNSYGYLLAMKYGTYNDSKIATLSTEFNAETSIEKEVTCTLNNEWSDKIRHGVAAIIKAIEPIEVAQILADDSYFAAELTINKFLYDYNGKNSDNDIDQTAMFNSGRYKEFYDLAVNAYNSYSVATLSLSTNNLTFTKQGNNYVSNVVTVNSNSPNWSVTSNVGAISKSGNTFTITVPVSSLSAGSTAKVTVEVSNSKSNDMARNYTCGSYQTLTPILVESAVTTAKVNATGQITVPQQTKLTIKKVDQNGKNVSGATLKIEGPNSYTKTIVTTNSNIVLDDLALGTYTITEVSTPEGYVGAKSVKVTLTERQPVMIVTLINNKTKVQILKVDENNQPLVGAKLQFRDEEGNVLYEWESTQEAYTIENLPIGRYYIVELETPDRYAKAGRQMIEITENDFEKEITFVNKKNKVSITKIDENGNILAGSKLQVQDVEGNIVSEWKSTQEAYTIEGLPKGTYYLVETASPKGYKLNEEKITFIVGDADELRVQMPSYLNVKVPNTLESTSSKIMTISTVLVAIGVFVIVFIKRKSIKA